MKRTALITGASSGIGRELALLHATAGDNLVITARRLDELKALQSEISHFSVIEVTVIAKDLSKQGAAKELFDEISDKGISVDYLINNAGFGGHGLFYERNWTADLAMINLNIIALTELTRHFLPGMIERGYGKILNIASTAGFMPGPLQAVYFATKAYVVSFSQALFEELKGAGITVTALCPGPVATGFIEASNLAGTLLFKKADSAEKIAKIGYKAMMKGKMLKITSFRLMINAIIPFTPRKMVLKTTRKLQEK